MKMTKKDFVEELKANDVSNAKDVYDTFIEIIATGLEGGNEVALNGIGTFRVVDTPARKGRNPQTGEAIDIKARKSLKFKASTTIKESINL